MLKKLLPARSKMLDKQVLQEPGWSGILETGMKNLFSSSIQYILQLPALTKLSLLLVGHRALFKGPTSICRAPTNAWIWRREVINLIASSGTSDISILCQFGIYCFVGFKESTRYSSGK